MAIPNFIICGTTKGGTTPLKVYLEQHPDIFMAKQEIHYFDVNNNYNKGFLWYQNKFQEYKNQKAIGEKTPNYMFKKYVPKRIFNALPDVKLIFLLRNPVDRVYSDFWMSIRNGIIRKQNFNKIIKDKSSHYIRRGLYAEQIREFLKYFKKENILFIISEEFRTNTEAILNNVIEFIGVDSFNFIEEKRYGGAIKYKSLTYIVKNITNLQKYIPFKPLKNLLIKIRRKIKRFNRTDEYPPMNEKTRKELEEYYKKYNDELEDLIDIKLSRWWK